jgi:hypothetical protein
MLRTVCAICICLAVLPAVGETGTKYEIGTIIGVKPHPSAADNPLTGVGEYEVSIKVADTIYVVLYTDRFGTKTVKYAAGRQLMVHVGENTVTYNDILGQSYKVPIISQKPATIAKQSK